MKKFLIAALAAASLTMVSCSSNKTEAQLQDYYEQMDAALKAGDYDKYEAIQQACTEWQATLSEEDQATCNRTILMGGELYSNVYEQASQLAAKKLQEEVQQAAEELNTALGADGEDAPAGDLGEALEGAIEDMASDVAQAMGETAQAYTDAAKAAAGQAQTVGNNAVKAAQKQAGKAVQEAQRQATKAVDDAQKQAAKAMESAQKQAADALKQYGL